MSRFGPMMSRHSIHSAFSECLTAYVSGARDDLSLLKLGARCIEYPSSILVRRSASSHSVKSGESVIRRFSVRACAIPGLLAV
jgi:hypothetical protein